MDGSVVLLLFIVGVAVTGLVLRDRSRNDPRRWRVLLQSTHPGVTIVGDASDRRGTAATFAIRGRTLLLRAEAPHLMLETHLPETPLPWTQAARALGDGELLAALMQPELALDGGLLSMRLPMKSIRGRHLRAAIERLLTLAERLEALPMAAALARHVLDFAPPDEREGVFSTLCALHPTAEATRQCALACLDEEEHPGLVALARAHLAAHGDEGAVPAGP
jgi:hypothetical protein